jgi:hypothetical protein
MLHHRTTDPIQRLEHIVNRIQRQHERELAAQHVYPHSDWPDFWIEAYDELLPEFTTSERSEG